MSDNVNRWRIPKILYPCYGPENETAEVVPAAAYDAVVKERDQAHGVAQACERRAEKAEAERDALKATVERVRDHIAKVSSANQVARPTGPRAEGYLDGESRLVREIQAALEPQGEKFTRKNHGDFIPTHPNQRGTTGFDARGRRQREDRNLPYEYWSNDRRRRTRRGGRGV